MTEPILKAKALSFGYSGNEVIKGVSLSVSKGEYVSLVGVNGCGKTTLLGLLSGFFKPHRGEVLLGGRKLSRISFRERAKDLAVVTQGQDMCFPFSCLEIVLMGLHPSLGRFQSPSGEQLETARELMDSCDVWRFADKPITEVSGGERQRVVLARALMQQPRVLLLDEAMSEMDVAAKYAMMKLLRNRVEKTSMSVVSIHHDLSTVYRFSDRVCALKDGRVFAEGEPRQVMDEIGRAHV